MTTDPVGLQELWCYGCTGLTELPVIPPTLQELGCAQCTRLTKLPLIPPGLLVDGMDLKLPK